MAKVVIGRSVDAASDVQSPWFWKSLQYAYKDSAGHESPALGCDVVPERLEAGALSRSSPFRVCGQDGAWEPWGTLEEFIGFYGDPFATVFGIVEAEVAEGIPPSGAQTGSLSAAELFAKYDADSSGTLDREEVLGLLAAEGVACGALLYVTRLCGAAGQGGICFG